MTETPHPPAPRSIVTRDLADEAATADLARGLAACAGPGDVMGLHGNLGAGKTSFARAFIRAYLGRDNEEVPSPTFTLVQTYGGRRGEIWHVDAYRLKTPEEILELGLDEAFAEGIVLIEWPERLGRHLPGRRLDLTLAPGSCETARRATLEDRNGGDWCRRLARIDAR